MNRNVVLSACLLFVLCLALTSCGGSSSTASTPQPVAVGFTPQSVCRVPNVVGLDQAVAEDLIVQLGLQPVKNLQYDAAIAAGAVIAQSPAADTRLEPCQGDVDLVISRGEPPKLTDTPAPTNTPAPPTPTPTTTPVPPTPTPTPDPRLFWDDFENGVKTEWGMVGDNFTVINGRLKSEGYLEASIGNGTWDNYVIALSAMPELRYRVMEIRMRVQDRDNYMLLKSTSSNGVYMTWYRVTRGVEQEIPGSRLTVLGGGDRDYKIEVEGQVYRTYVNGERRQSFIDDSFSNGGVTLIINNGSFELDGIEVTAIP